VSINLGFNTLPPSPHTQTHHTHTNTPDYCFWAVNNVMNLVCYTCICFYRSTGARASSFVATRTHGKRQLMETGKRTTIDDPLAISTATNRRKKQETNRQDKSLRKCSAQYLHNHKLSQKLRIYLTNIFSWYKYISHSITTPPPSLPLNKFHLAVIPTRNVLGGRRGGGKGLKY
jgi:hypothetical protein